jgi:hypothetical protein
MQRNTPDSKSIKDEIDRNAENFLKEVELANKKALETLKSNPNQNISSKHSFVGASFTLFPDVSSLITFCEERNKNQFQSEPQKPRKQRRV